MKKVLAILGSPRIQGNTDTLLEKALEPIKKAKAPFKKIVLNDLTIRPCQECEKCYETGICVLNDDMALIYKELEKSDIIIVASPIYFGNITAQTKIMVDRMQCFWARKYLLKKPPVRSGRVGVFISCGVFKKERFFECAKKVIEVFFKVQDIKYDSSIFVEGVDKKGDIFKFNDKLKEAYTIGEKVLKEI